jgi:hypothetical protein
MQRFQENAVGIAVHQPFDRRMGEIADRIGAFFGRCFEFGNIGHELQRDGIVRIRRVDQRGEGWRDRHGVTGRDGFECRGVGFRNKPGADEIGNGAQGLVHGTGVQMTCSI